MTSTSMEAPTTDQNMRISFMNQDGDTTIFRIKRNAKVMNLLKKYCYKKQLDYKTVQFIHNGRRLPRRGAIQEVGVENDDEIVVVVDAEGGGPSKLRLCE